MTSFTCLFDEASALPWRVRSKRQEKLSLVSSLWDAYQHTPRGDRRKLLYSGDTRRGALFEAMAVFMAEEALDDSSTRTISMGLLFWLLARGAVDFRERVTTFVLLWTASEKSGESLGHVYDGLIETYPELEEEDFTQLLRRDPKLNSLTAVGLTIAERGDRLIFKPLS